MLTELASSLGLIPLCSGWLGSFALCRELAARGKLPEDWRISFLLANAIWGALAVWLVEAAGAGHTLTAPALLAGWTLAVFLLFGSSCFLAFRRGGSFSSWLPRPEAGPERPWPLAARLCLGASILIALVLGAIALLTPTTNYDSLTYHLPRVMHWIQNQSVAHFPTSDTRQLESGPWAAFILTHLILLSGGDWFANLAQWWAMVSTIVGASWMTTQLLFAGQPERDGGGTAGLDRAVDRHRLATALTSLLIVSVPTGIVQSVTTQNDYVVACWLMTLVVFGWALVRVPGNVTLGVGAALATALGLLSKVTFLIYAGPFLVGGGLLILARLGRNAARARLAITVLVIVASLNAPHFARNWAVFGSPLGSHYMFLLQRNQSLSVSGTVSNLIRNLSLHAATGWEPLTRGINGCLGLAHRLSGRDLNDRDTTFITSPFAFQTGFPISDNLTGSFHHLLLAAVAGLAACLLPCAFRRPMAFLFCGVVLSMIVFCAYLRWQAWHARFHLPLLLLLMPPTAAVLAGIRARWGLGLISAGLALLAFICVGWNESRPVLADGGFLFQPREQQYFLTVSGLYAPAVAVAEDLVTADCKEVGLRVRHNFFEYCDDIEYVHWVLLRNRGFRGRIHHAFFQNESAALRPLPAHLDAVISSPGPQVAELTNAFPQRVVHDPFAVYWSDASSRWARLDKLDGGTVTGLAPSGSEIPLREDRVELSFRSARQGMLRLRGRLRSDSGTSLAAHRLFVRSDSGYARLIVLGSEDVSLEIPMRPGVTALGLQLVRADAARQGTVAMRGFEWQWQPVDEPLKWIVPTALDLPGQPGKGGGKIPFRITQEPMVLQLDSGSDGEAELLVEVHFEPGAKENEQRRIVLATHDGRQGDAMVGQGQNLLQAPVVRGPNAIGFLWPEAAQAGPLRHVEVTDLQCRFSTEEAPPARAPAVPK